MDLDFGKHEYQTTKSMQLVKIIDSWIERFPNGKSINMPSVNQDLSVSLEGHSVAPKKMGWAIPKRTFRRYCVIIL